MILGCLIADLYGDAVAELHVHLLVLPVLDDLCVGDGRGVGGLPGSCSNTGPALGGLSTSGLHWHFQQECQGALHRSVMAAECCSTSISIPLASIVISWDDLLLHTSG